MHQDLSPHHHHPKDPLLRSLAGSVAVGMPSLFIAVWLFRSSPIPEQPSLTVLIILGMAAANFFIIHSLEKHRHELGRLTLHALVLCVGIVLLYILADTFNRYVSDIGFGWLTAPVLAAMGLTYIALFRENFFAVKLLLAMNGVMLGGLWCLGESAKLALPF
ncbi:MAG: hypothetical protein RBS08_02985 [Bdellovibrionales bacterium]|jgi:hypothetical protein|nr:hypothetical protein [Bdellovibrionales bacterium]